MTRRACTAVRSRSKGNEWQKSKRPHLPPKCALKPCPVHSVSFTLTSAVLSLSCSLSPFLTLSRPLSLPHFEHAYVPTYVRVYAVNAPRQAELTITNGYECKGPVRKANDILAERCIPFVQGRREGDETRWQGRNRWKESWIDKQRGAMPWRKK